MKNQVYKITLVKTEIPLLGLFLNKRIKAIGNGYLPNNPAIMLITHEDKSYTHVLVHNYQRIKISKEMFYIQAENAEEKSNGTVNKEQLVKS